MTSGEAVTSVAQLLARADATPDVVAMRVLESGVWVEYGWGDVARTVTRVAAVLADAGVRTGGTVGVVCGSRAEWPVCIWAVHALGATAVALSCQADEAVLGDAAARHPEVWILEGLEAHDRLRAIDPGGTGMLVLDDVELSDPGSAVWTWQRDVVGADPAADAERRAKLVERHDAASVDGPALILAEESGRAVDLRAPVGAGSADRTSPAGLEFISTDEYLAFLPPTWPTEASVLLSAHPAGGGVVSFGSRVGGGLAELATVQPTLVQAPAAWWDAMAAHVVRQATEPAPLAGRALEAVVRGDAAGGVFAKRARRKVRRHLGLARVREARVLGTPDAATVAVLDGLGVPRPLPLAVPEALAGSIDQSASAAHPDPRSLEEAK